LVPPCASFLAVLYISPPQGSFFFPTRRAVPLPVFSPHVFFRRADSVSIFFSPVKIPFTVFPPFLNSHKGSGGDVHFFFPQRHRAVTPFFSLRLPLLRGPPLFKRIFSSFHNGNFFFLPFRCRTYFPVSLAFVLLFSPLAGRVLSPPF